MIYDASMKSKSKGRTNQSKDLSPDLKIQLFRFYREFNLHLGQFSNRILATKNRSLHVRLKIQKKIIQADVKTNIRKHDWS